MISVFGRGQSSRKLAKALGVPHNSMTASKIIRYKTVEPYRPGIPEINTSQSVRNASHKYNSLVLMKGAGINVPPFNKDFDRLLSAVGSSSIILARNNYHTKGQDIIVIKGEKAFDINMQELGSKNSVLNQARKDYYIQYIKPTDEYRYHVAFGKVILPTKKILAEGETDDSIVRNHQGGKWKQVVCRETANFSEACIKAVAVHGLDFGAVDFISIRGVPFLLEVNTAPGLIIQNRLDAYVKAFKENI